MRPETAVKRQELSVVYVGPVDFHSSSAPAQRMMGISQSLVLAGDRVHVGSGARSAPDSSLSNLGNVQVSLLAELPDPRWNRIRRVLRGLTCGGATVSWIKRLDPTPDVILLYGTPIGYLVRLLPLARRLGVPLAIDVTEWYQSSHLPGGRFGPFAIANMVAMRFLAKRADGVIAISQRLEKHFSAPGTATLRIPPLFASIDGVEDNSVREGPLTLCYVGSPGLKDKQTLLNLVSLPLALGLSSSDLRVHIAGVDKSAAIDLLGNRILKAVHHECLHFYGRVTSDHARRIVSYSHFSVLQRGNQRYAQAGFPSKVPESLLLGTPVMVNLTSDLSLFLVDGTNSTILADETLEALVAGVSEALRQTYNFDRRAIASAAKVHFSPAQFADPLHNFLERVSSRR